MWEPHGAPGSTCSRYHAGSIPRRSARARWPRGDRAGRSWRWVKRQPTCRPRAALRCDASLASARRRAPLSRTSRRALRQARPRRPLSRAAPRAGAHSLARRAAGQHPPAPVGSSGRPTRRAACRRSPTANHRRCTTGGRSPHPWQRLTVVLRDRNYRGPTLLTARSTSRARPMPRSTRASARASRKRRRSPRRHAAPQRGRRCGRAPG